MGQPPTPVTLTADELRETWLSFFEARDHARVASASLVPENDPTLLFTGAGMNQFKDCFVGRGELPYRRATSVQKCFRQGDLDNVGRTARHLTFFEMMGHFSFGDYFKKEAIAWAWEFLRDVLAFPAERLWVSVYRDDEEAFDTWRALGVPRERIARFGADENFWPANAPEEGPDGVCGPCSEVYFDFGEARAKGDGGPGAYDSGRFTEIWNSVFTQFERRGRNNLLPLPQKNIDCGVGFDRTLAVVEGQYSVFGTSIFRPILQEIARISGTEYEFPADGGLPTGEPARRMRRIADHVRAACFLVGDGVKPSNEGRGYVLRRILRLAIRDGIQLGLEDAFLASLVPSVVTVMQGGYPELAEGRAVLADVVAGEEKRFRGTYNQGVRFLDEAAAGLSKGGTLPGAKAFKLYDTYGFPVDLAERILAERGIGVDHEGFAAEMRAQQERARAGSKISGAIFAGGPLTDLKAKSVAPTVFLGHGDPSAAEGSPAAGGVAGDAVVVGLVHGETLSDEANEGDEVTVVLDRTPFYAESGGQVGDRGVLRGPSGWVEVHETQAREGYVLHEGVVAEGTLRSGDAVQADVDEAGRDATRRNHTATHLLHLALKQILGDHVRQEGSLVGPEHLRFDFGHDQALTSDEWRRVEERVNDWILRNDVVETQSLPIEEAKASGAVSLFGEKYGDVVRVVGVSSGSRELCGGTHVRRTGDIGSFRITSEASIAAGVRRIEAMTGFGAIERAADDRQVVQDLSMTLKAASEEIVERVQALQTEIRQLKKAEDKARREAGLQAVSRLVDEAEEVDGLRVVRAGLDGVDGKALRGAWDALRAGGVDVGVLVGEAPKGAPLLVGLSKSALDRGLDARTLLGIAAAPIGGRGGGRPELAQGQGKDRGGLAASLEAAELAIREALSPKS